jgi:hypothetical protein
MVEGSSSQFIVDLRNPIGRFGWISYFGELPFINIVIDCN